MLPSSAPIPPRRPVLLLNSQLFVAEMLAYCLAALGGFEVKVAVSADQFQEMLNNWCPALAILSSDGHHNKIDSTLKSLSGRGSIGKTLVTALEMEPAKWRQLREAGVGGIFSFSEPLQNFVLAAKAVASGSRWFGEEPSCPPNPSPRLSNQERRITELVVQGLSNKEIAARLNISESGVRGALSRVFLKMGVQTRVQVVRAVLVEGCTNQPRSMQC